MSIDYTPPPKPAANALRLHCNEGARPPIADADVVRQYPDLTDLGQRIAERLNRPSNEVLIGAGADDIIDRVMRAFAGPDTMVVVPDPTFEMIPAYAAQSGATVLRIAWEREFPTDTIVDVGRRAAVVVLVTPDNPTGRSIEWESVARIARTLPDTIVLLDQAYGEYADEDYTPLAAEFSNIVVARTMSKAWGLAGLRVGYAVASAPLIESLRRAGSPYPVSALSAQVASDCLMSPDYMGEHVARVRDERVQLCELLDDLGARPTPSAANFVLARFTNAGFTFDALAALGVAVRSLTDRPGLEDALRIGCPGGPQDFDRLSLALRTALRPEALIFDMDGVLADVRESYRAAIEQTCGTFGATVTRDDIAAQKAKPGSNDDFIVTQRLLAAAGVDVALADVTAEFQHRYDDGLFRTESLLIPRSELVELSQRLPLAVVTGRPRRDAERFLETHNLGVLFAAVVCREDASLKPDPAPVELALRLLGASTAWMFGDTVDDVLAAAAAGVLPIGVTAPGEANRANNDNLLSAGAARAASNLTEALSWLT